MLLDIEESFTKSWIDSSKDRFGCDKGICVVVTCLGGGLSSDKKALYESDMSCGRSNCPRGVFSLSREISGCVIALVDGAQWKYKR